jgi:hypothetical protein
LASPAAADAVAPVTVTSSSVTLQRAGVAPVKVRCNRDRSCHGTLVLSAPCDQRDAPVLMRGCRVPVGTRGFAVAAHRTRSVAVRRNGVRFTSGSGDAATVRAVAYLGTADGQRGGRARALTVTASPSLPRPDVEPALFRLDALRVEDDASVYDLAFEVDVPRGSFSAEAAVGDRTAPLHPAGSEPFVVPAGSWAPGGVSFHGTLRAGKGELPPHSSQSVRVTGCTIRGCQSTATTVQLPGPDDPRPICHIGLGPVSAQTRLLAGLPR